MRGSTLSFTKFSVFQGCHTLREFRETQGILIYVLYSGKLSEVLIFSKKFREILRFKKSQNFFFLDLE